MDSVELVASSPPIALRGAYVITQCIDGTVTLASLDGVEATRRIKARRPETQVILTFYGDPEWTQGTDEADAFCYLVKGCHSDS